VTPTDELREQLRLLLDETIPEGGTAADTLFTDAELDLLLTLSSTLDQAAAAGWKLKAQRVMSPTAVVEARFGSESFRFTSPKDLADFALGMAQRFSRGRVLSLARPRLPGVASAIGCPCGCEGSERCLVALCGSFTRQCSPAPRVCR
jgi:hypothetical protein